jgi:hypothetical protein
MVRDGTVELFVMAFFSKLFDQKSIFAFLGSACISVFM